MHFVVVTETGDTPANKIIDRALLEKKDSRGISKVNLEESLRATGNVPLEVIQRVDDPRLRGYRDARYRIFELRDGYLQEPKILDMLFPIH